MCLRSSSSLVFIQSELKILRNFLSINVNYVGENDIRFLGPIGPLVVALSVCLSVCMSVCNTIEFDCNTIEFDLMT